MTNKTTILSLASKVNQAAEDNNVPESPAETIRRLSLVPGMSTPSRKRKATISLLDDDDMEEQSTTARPSSPETTYPPRPPRK